MAQKTWKQNYVGKYGMQPVPERDSPDWTQEWQDDWDAGPDNPKQQIKDLIPDYQGPGSDEQTLTDAFHAARQGGPDTNIWKGLGEMFGVKPGALKKWGMDLLGGLTKGTDFSEEYGVGKDALNQQLRDTERGMYDRGAARGLLDSSATQAQLGGARGGYANALAGLMQWKGQAEEQSRQFNLSSLGTLGGYGMNFGQFLNSQYMQDMGLRAQEINYLANERSNENNFGLQKSGIWGSWNPTTLGDVGPGLLQLAGTIASGGMPMPDFGDWSGGTTGGGGTGYGTMPQGTMDMPGGDGYGPYSLPPMDW